MAVIRNVLFEKNKNDWITYFTDILQNSMVDFNKVEMGQCWLDIKSTVFWCHGWNDENIIS